MLNGYFLILERIGDRIEDLEEDLLDEPRPETMQTIHRLKGEMLLFRRLVWPLREVIISVERGESVLIKESTGIYMRDVYDHTIHVIDTVETFRDLLSGLLDLYISSVSNKMN